MAETLGEAVICSWTTRFRKAPGTLFLTATRLVHIANAGEETAIHLDGDIKFELTKKKPGFDHALVRLSGPALSGKLVMEFTDEQKWSQLREFSEFMQAREKAKVQVAWFFILDISYYFLSIFSFSPCSCSTRCQDLSGTSVAQQHVQSTHSVLGSCMDFSTFDGQGTAGKLTQRQHTWGSDQRGSSWSSSSSNKCRLQAGVGHLRGQHIRAQQPISVPHPR